jgi:hypothetical protein
MHTWYHECNIHNIGFFPIKFELIKTLTIHLMEEHLLHIILQK